jgi:hypothetical protein
MKLAGNVAAVTSQKHYAAIYFPCLGYCFKMAGTGYELFAVADDSGRYVVYDSVAR